MSRTGTVALVDPGDWSDGCIWCELGLCWLPVPARGDLETTNTKARSKISSTGGDFGAFLWPAAGRGPDGAGLLMADIPESYVARPTAREVLPVPPINVLSLTQGGNGRVGMGSVSIPRPEAFRHRATGQLAVRAAIFRGPRDIDVGERPDPGIGEPTDAIVRVVLACVCGSDLWYRRGESPYAVGSIGHEFIGVVEETGAEVSSSPRDTWWWPPSSTAHLQRPDMPALPAGIDDLLRAGWQLRRRHDRRRPG